MTKRKAQTALVKATSRFVPNGSRVMVRALEEGGTRTADGNFELDSGIVLPGNRKAAPAYKGLVVEVGDECQNTKAGDLILFAAYTGATIKLPGMEVTFMDEADILAHLRTTPEPLSPNGRIPSPPDADVDVSHD